jgi:general secretion pathway protein K
VVVIWLMAALMTLASGFSTESGTAVRLARNTLESAEARALADGGVYLALRGLLEDSDPSEHWAADGRPRQVTVGDATVSVAVLDEAGKVDLNAAPDELLLNLLAQVEVTDEAAASLADAIADWRDPDDLARLRGAEAAEYRRQGLPYEPSNAPFATVSELRLVLGMTPEIYKRLAPLVTVHSRNARINPISAPAEVVRALPGVSREAADAFLEARGRPDVPLNGAMANLAGAGQYLARALPQAVTIRSKAALPNGGVFVREATVELSRTREATYRIVIWRQAMEEAGA